MKTLNKNQLSFIFKILFFLIGVIITVFIIPDSNKFKYEYQKGEPWKHHNLIAEYSFPVYKSKETIKHETDSILKNSKPYFKYNNLIFIAITKELNADFDKINKKLESEAPVQNRQWIIKFFNDSIKYKIYKKIENIYSIGIIESIPGNKNSENDQSRVLVIKDNISETQSYNYYYSQKKAYNELNSLYQSIIARRKFTYPSLDFSKYLTYNIIFDENMTAKAKEQLLTEITPVRGMIQAGERIIYEGQLINEDKYQILSSLEKEYLSERVSYSDKALIFLGQFILTASIFTVLFLYLFFYNKPVFNNNRKVLYFLSLTLLFIIAVAALSKQEVVSIYLVPVTVLPLITATFYKPKTAFLHHVITIIMLGFIVANSFEYVFIQFIAGFAAISGVSRLNRRSQILLTSLLIFLTYLILYIALTIIHEGGLKMIETDQIAWFAGGSFLVLLSYPLIFIFEKVFGFISDVTLVELSDTNRPLLKLLAEKAPGTFQHSVQVANISEEAARVLDANPLLVRAGALYHDIGKMNNPSFFIENQHSENPHEKINPMQSTKIIKKHVVDGIIIAKKYGLPKEIIDFIPTHHGNSKIAWFLFKYKEQNNNAPINEEEFRYDGKLPYSKETAIVMIVDSVEAASRSLPKYTEESIDELVEKIVNIKISDNLLIDADITFAEISTVKKVLKNKLKNIYHTRVEYPK